MKTETAVLGGGCFWCTEAVFKMLRGVISVEPGYTGGTVPNPTYKQVCVGNTGYAECVKVEFNPAEITYRDILTVFFGSHDPTTPNRQGNDVGEQYRSIIFYTTPEQKETAEKFITELNASSSDGRKIVTELAPLGTFYVAENYHRDYFARNKNASYCEVIINPKLEKVQKEFANLLRSSPKLKTAKAQARAALATTEEEIKKKLTPEEYAVLRGKGTEPPFSGKLLHDDRSGMYRCKVCGNPLFASTAKFDSGTGWPSFDEALPSAVEQIVDDSHGMTRIEIVCARCKSHLGHVFDDGPTKTGKRYCLNSVCLDLDEESAK